METIKGKDKFPTKRQWQMYFKKNVKEAFMKGASILIRGNSPIQLVKKITGSTHYFFKSHTDPIASQSGDI